MTKEELLERLLHSYEQSFDIERPYELDGEEYDAFAAFNVVSAKYVLSKKAELWRAQCYEYVFFQVADTVTVPQLEAFARQIENTIEPKMVRHGEKLPPENHMYSFITGIFICDHEVSEEVRKWLHKYKYMKNYRFTIRGYCDARVAVFDLESRKIFGNAAARDIVKGYKKIL